MTRACSAVVIVSLAWVCPITGWAEPPILQELAAGNQHSLQLIRTFSCRVSHTHQPAGILPSASGVYYRSGDTVRIKWQLGDEKFDALVENSIVQVIHARRDFDGVFRPFANLSQYQSVPIGPIDVWPLTMCTLSAPGDLRMRTIDQLLEHHRKLVRRVDLQSIDGKDQIHIQLANGESHSEYWFDPHTNYLARRYTASWPVKSPGATMRTFESEVASFTEPAPGLFFPSTVRMRHFMEGKEVGSQELVLSQVQINQPLPEGALAFRIPADTLVSNRITGTQYRVDAAGLPKGRIRDLPENPLPAAQPAPFEPTSGEIGWLAPIVGASLGLVGAGVAIWVLQRRRARPQQCS